MSEIKTIPTTTDIIIYEDSIFINTVYREESELPNTINTILSEIVGIIDGVPYIEGELVIQMKNYPSDINYILDGQGNLIVFVSTEDLDYYSINENGDLVWIP